MSGAAAMALHLHISSSAQTRLAFARDALRSAAPGQRVLIIAATRGAADDLARQAAATNAATFGVQRFSLTQFAVRTAIVALAEQSLAPSSWLGAEAVAARVTFEAGREQGLRYFAPVATSPGFPRALARTVQELRLAAVSSNRLSPLAPAGPDIASLLDRFDESFASVSSVDRSELFRTAAAALDARFDLVILLDIAIEHAADRPLVEAIVSAAATTIATAPPGDVETVECYATLGALRAEMVDAGGNDLAHLRRFLFQPDLEPDTREPDGSLQFFSAPGEGRECVEIARRILNEARAGVKFDEIAILVRSPQSYFGLLEHALRRADVPAWFDRGTRRPHPAGRAFLALLACAAEQLSVSRFAEYLSLAQMPQSARGTPPSPGGEAQDGSVVIPLDEALSVSAQTTDEAPEESPSAQTLPSPWRWEKLLVEAAVIGQSAERWQRRLAGKSAELQRQVDELSREEGEDGGRVQSLRRTLEQLGHLTEFALPIINELARWPDTATWGVWLDAFTAIAPRVLRRPEQVLRVLADLHPMAGIGPIDLDEARRVLAERLLTLESEPPARRFGRVFVGTPQQARGRSFRIVFVPGLAERMFPQKPREDPLLLDGMRAAADASLRTQSRRLAAERLLLELAAGAAGDRLYVSYPRIELAESRARVPSFYALDVMRAVTGRIPDFEWLEERARHAGNATLAWPAPPNPQEAIDDLEHDLSTLRQLLDERDRTLVKGHAHYLLKLNECLRRNVVGRWARGEQRWSPNDGLIRVSPDTRAALAAQRLAARPYSLSALQRFSACPYQFLLAAVYRLQPLEMPEPLQRMDPLTRGSLFHEMQARFLRILATRHALPVTEDTIDDVRGVLDQTVDAVAAAAYDTLAPAVDRVWMNEIGSIRRDLHAWLRYLGRDGAEWLPKHFEFAFGTVPGERDPDSVRDEVTVEGGYRLRGAVDLIEEHRATGTLRVTDHKTGRKPDRIEKVIIGGGAVLQPVLYSMAIERALDRRVSQGRLFYCTAAGSYQEHEIPLNERTRAAGTEALQVIDRAIEAGFLAAAPADDACARCDYRPVCGPDVFRRVSRKPQDRLADLHALRGRP